MRSERADCHKNQWMKDLSTRKFDASATSACLGMLLFWSVGPIFIKYLTGYLDSWSQNMLRYLSACLFWLPYLLLAVRKKQLDHRVWRKAILPSAANVAMQSLWAAAFYYINPGFLVLLSKSSVIWIAGFSLIFFADERPLVKSLRFWAGLGLSLIGVIGVTLCREDFAVQKTVLGIGIGLGAAFMWGVYTILVKTAFKDIASRSSFSVISIYTVIGLCVLGLTFGRPADCLRLGAWSWACVVISGIVSIALGHVVYYVAVRRIGATIPSLVLLATPFTVLAISHIVFGESLNGLQWFFGVILIVGSALAIWSQRSLHVS